MRPDHAARIRTQRRRRRTARRRHAQGPEEGFVRLQAAEVHPPELQVPFRSGPSVHRHLIPDLCRLFAVHADAHRRLYPSDALSGADDPLRRGRSRSRLPSSRRRPRQARRRPPCRHRRGLPAEHHHGTDRPGNHAPASPEALQADGDPAAQLFRFALSRGCHVGLYQ